MKKTTMKLVPTHIYHSYSRKWPPKWKRSMNRKNETNDTNEMFCYSEFRTKIHVRNRIELQFKYQHSIKFPNNKEIGVA